MFISLIFAPIYIIVRILPVAIMVWLALLAAPVFAERYMAWPHLTENEFRTNITTFGRKGYIPVDIEIITGTKSRAFSLVMHKQASKAKSVVRTKLEDNEFKDVWRELLRKGYRPIDMESYEFDHRQYYGAIWLKDKNRSWVSYRDLSVKEFTLAYEEGRANGQVLLDVNAYTLRSKLRFSAIFVPNPEHQQWKFNRKLRVEDFTPQMDLMRSKGFRLMDVSAYQDRGGRYYAALWLRDNKSWRFERELDIDDFRSAMDLHARTGYELIDIEVYRTREGLRYSGIWLQE